ncbi:type II toxin-antitoxin system death-on-curing family toxin [Niabella yanshanensis]|uniref:Type II toxin-antitoxin system death-on-curing family toxin n=1 Tax=Niabella yanshanensis TaxID=577386 RepID=A0ABZ0W1N0_9BACT|nr:type II toxin-antitoxin system death-on-curing family toxin [Niabella yanshanensis]WQD37175.1 type II toxin-antitoxin system death-on-curing family toxin [Niabella yanshanensis]
MITLETILKIHRFSILKYGGADGVRDIGLLQSSIARPFQTIDGRELYESAFEKAAALYESLVANHPFIDGNKRTGFLAMVALIEYYGFLLIASEDEAYDFTIKVSTGQVAFDDIVKWLKENSSAT